MTPSDSLTSGRALVRHRLMGECDRACRLPGLAIAKFEMATLGAPDCPVDFRRRQCWPRRGRGLGDTPGPTTGRSPRESASAARQQSDRCWSIVGRLLDAPRQATPAVCPRCNNSAYIFSLKFWRKYQGRNEPRLRDLNCRSRLGQNRGILAAGATLT